MTKIIGVTGHRTLSHNSDAIVEAFLGVVNNLKDVQLISGMAIGYDQLVAEICLAADIKFIAAIPFEGQEHMWPKQTQIRYHELLNKAHKVHIVSDGGYEAWKMHVRNEWIVNNSESLFAYFDGRHIKGSGTSACVRYAEKMKKEIINIYELSSTYNLL